MNQLPLFNDTTYNKPVNVASIPLRSPFRYPGGKTWLVPLIRKWLTSFDSRVIHFYEPFAGGGIIGLTVAFEKLARDVTLVELDSEVSSVWKTILSDDNKWLAEKICNFNLTKESAERELNKKSPLTRDLAFQTILKNRISHGGILAPGAGLLKYGEGGKGIMSRWYPQTLCKRILAIGEIRERVHFIQGDGIDFLKSKLQRKNAVFFIDPPYTAGGKSAGSRLYTHYNLNHNHLFDLASNLKGEFLMTYDNADEVYKLAESHSLNTRLIPMNNTHHAEMKELIINRDLSWLD